MVNVSTEPQQGQQDAPALKFDLLEQSFSEVAPRGEEFVVSFYDRLFSMYPETKELFANTDMIDQRKKLLGALVLVVDNLRKPEVLGPALKTLGQRHRQMDVQQKHYPMVGAALLGTLQEFLGPKWTTELKNAWIEAYGAVVAGMVA